VGALILAILGIYREGGFEKRNGVGEGEKNRKMSEDLCNIIRHIEALNVTS
jgi:hypothetical protein